MQFDVSKIAAVESTENELALDLTAGFGDIVCAIRKRKGITQAALAEKVGYERVYIHRIESGKVKVPAITLRNIFDALGVEMRVSFEDKELVSHCPAEQS